MNYLTASANLIFLILFYYNIQYLLLIMAYYCGIFLTSQTVCILTTQSLSFFSSPKQTINLKCFASYAQEDFPHERVSRRQVFKTTNVKTFIWLLAKLVVSIHISHEWFIDHIISNAPPSGQSGVFFFSKCKITTRSFEKYQARKVNGQRWKTTVFFDFSFGLDLGFLIAP